MQFKEGTGVYTANGHKVGDIERFVLDPLKREISHLIVSKGFLFTTERIVPVSAVEQTTEDRVTLKANITNPDEFLEYEETHYISPDDHEVLDMFNEHYEQPLYYYPYLTPAYTGMAAPVHVPSKKVRVEVKNTPDNTITLEKGVDVISSDGEKVGTIEQIFANPEDQQVSHFAISTGWLFNKDEKLIPGGWIDDVQEDAVHLAVSKKTLERLADF